MKKIFIIFCIIWFGYCGEYILKAGKRTKGHWNRNDYVFSFQNSFYLSKSAPRQKFEINLLMERDIVSKCKIKSKRLLSKKFDISCKIKRYSGCNKKLSLIPELRNKEPENIFLDNGDIVRFQGFSLGVENNNIREEYDNPNENELNKDLIESFQNKLYGEENLLIFITAKNITKDLDNNKIFDIINEEIKEDITDIRDELKNLDISLDLIVNDKSTNAICKIWENNNFKCEINDDIIENSQTIIINKDPETIKLPDGINILYFSGFSGLSLYTLTLGKIVKDECISNECSFKFIESSISKTILETKINLRIPILVNNEISISFCSLDDKLNFNSLSKEQ